MVGEDVDRSSLSEDIERDFGRDLPIVGSEDLKDAVHESGMASIEQALEPLALPQQANIDPHIQRGRDANEGMDGDRVCMSTLDSIHDRSRHSRLGADLTLG